MARYGRHYPRHQLQFITASTYRRTALFKSPGFCREFVQILDRAAL